MKLLKRIFVVLLILLVLFQLYPKGAKNDNPDTSRDLSRIHTVPPDVRQILETSCYDCHSNRTVYPWYAQIQPVSLWLNDHIIEGKKELNFSEFSSYKLSRQYRKLEEINEQVKEGEMPLASYTLIHTNARLCSEQKLTVAAWATTLRDSLQKNYPADSLLAKKK
jgi:Haem-binding domain